MATRKLHTIEKRIIPSSDRDIRILIMRPTKNARPRESTPGILWLHGGGHLHGMHPKILLPHARLLVEKYGAVVVAPEYCTAFEKPFPADLEDCYAALLFLKVHADELGINDAQIMVGGESAGGGLTVATCLLARDIGEVNIAFQMPLYPMPGNRLVARQPCAGVEHAHQPVRLEVLSPRFGRRNAPVLRRPRPRGQLCGPAPCLRLCRH